MADKGRINWGREEHILALALYKQNPNSPPGKSSTEVAELSKLLHNRAIGLGLSIGESFRNANGVYMKMMNFRSLDPLFTSQGKSGLSNNSKDEQIVWDEFEGNLDGLKLEVERIKLQITGEQSDNSNPFTQNNDLDVDIASFDKAWSRFLELVKTNDKGRSFNGFNEGIAAVEEDYKPRLRDHAINRLDADSWLEADLGTGEILRKTIDAIEIQEPSKNLINNLVFWQNRFGHNSRDHAALLDGQIDAELGKDIEQQLYMLFKNDIGESQRFEDLSRLVSHKYPLLAYLFFLKDDSRFLPIQPTGFDKAFRELGVNFTTRGQCSWSNYITYVAVIEKVRQLITSRTPHKSARLIDAHSFCWLLVKLPNEETLKKTGGAGTKGSKLGSKDVAIYNMCESIQKTVGQSHGQLVTTKIKSKELHIDRTELAQLLEKLIDKQDGCCALTGIAFDYSQANKDLLPSADRIESNGHYTLGNLQVVCQFVNFWKSARPNDEFINLLNQVRGLDA